jgi:hypothetical protein
MIVQGYNYQRHVQTNKYKLIKYNRGVLHIQIIVNLEPFLEYSFPLPIMFDPSPKLQTVLMLAGAVAFKRKSMVITKLDVIAATRRVYPQTLDTFIPCLLPPSTTEVQTMYTLLTKTFGPGINLTNSAFLVVRGLDCAWKRHIEPCTEVEAG